MSGVNAHKTAAVGAALFDGNLTCRRSHRHKLLCYNVCIGNGFAIHRYRIGFQINLSVF